MCLGAATVGKSWRSDGGYESYRQVSWSRPCWWQALARFAPYIRIILRKAMQVSSRASSITPTTEGGAQYAYSGSNGEGPDETFEAILTGMKNRPGTGV